MEKTVQANSVDDAIDKVKSDCPAGMKTCWKCWKNIKEEALQCKYCRSECIHRNQDEFIASVKKGTAESSIEVKCPRCAEMIPGNSLTCPECGLSHREQRNVRMDDFISFFSFDSTTTKGFQSAGVDYDKGIAILERDSGMGMSRRTERVSMYFTDKGYIRSMQGGYNRVVREFCKINPEYGLNVWTGAKISGGELVWIIVLGFLLILFFMDLMSHH